MSLYIIIEYRYEIVNIQNNNIILAPRKWYYTSIDGKMVGDI